MVSGAAGGHQRDRGMSPPLTCPVCRAPLAADWEVAFMSIDRTYLEEHPNAVSYQREVFPDEHPFVCDGADYVEVQQTAPGLRHRAGYRVLTIGGVE